MARILIIDDDESTLVIVRAVFESRGHEVVVFSDPRTVLASSFLVPDAIVLDVIMPELSGWELLGQLRADRRTSGVPILMLSSAGTSPNKVRGLREGADDFVTKPFEPEELAARVEVLIERSSSRFEGLQGSLDSQHLGELLQILEQGGQSGDLWLQGASETGCISFAEGYAAEAMLGHLRGEEALLALLAFRQGRFRFSPGAVPASDASIRPSALLLAAAWLEDEGHRIGSPMRLASQEIYRLTGDPGPPPQGWEALPVGDVLALLRDEISAADLEAALPYAPQKVAMVVTWLDQRGCLARTAAPVAPTPPPTPPPAPKPEPAPAPGLNEAELFLKGLRHLAEARFRPGQAAVIGLAVHPFAWDDVVALLSRLPAGGRRRAVSPTGPNRLPLGDGLELHLRPLNTALRPEEIAGATPLALVLWTKALFSKQALARLAQAAVERLPSDTVLLMVGDDAAARTIACEVAADAGRWVVVDGAPRSLRSFAAALTAGA